MKNKKPKATKLTPTEIMQRTIVEEQLGRVTAERDKFAAQVTICDANRRAFYTELDKKYGGPGLEVFIQPDGSIVCQPKGQPPP